MCLTFVTVGELTFWAEKRNFGTRRRTDLMEWIVSKPLVDTDLNTALRWGRMKAGWESRGRPCPYNDSWIAATCLEAGLPLATNNVKDFTDLVDHEGLRLITA